MEQMESQLRMNLVEVLSTFAGFYGNNDTPGTDSDETKNEDFTSALSTITRNSNKQMGQMMKMFQTLNKKFDDIIKKPTRKTLIQGLGNRFAAIAGLTAVAIIGAINILNANQGTSLMPLLKSNGWLYRWGSWRMTHEGSRQGV